MSDERRSEGGGAIVVIVVVLIIFGLVGIVGVGGGAWVYHRANLLRMEAEVQERRAMAAMMEAEMRAKSAALESMKTLQDSIGALEREQDATSHELLLQIDAAGNLALAGKPVKLEKLLEVLKQAKVDHPDGVKLKIQAHADTPYVNVVGVTDAATNAGIASQSIEVSPQPAKTTQP